MMIRKLLLAAVLAIAPVAAHATQMSDLTLNGTPLSSLPTTPASTMTADFCSDCKQATNPCATTGGNGVTGSLAIRQAGASNYRCDGFVAADALTVGGFTPAQLRDRSTHTGTQLSSTISDFTEAAQDATGAMATNTATANLSYSDPTPSLSVDVLNSPLLGGSNGAFYLARANHTGTQAPATLAFAATDRLLCRDTAGAGTGEECPVGNGLNFTGGPGLACNVASGSLAGCLSTGDYTSFAGKPTGSGSTGNLAAWASSSGLGNFTPPGPACSNQVATNIGATGAPTCATLTTSFLPATTVNSVVNDTNVTGSITAQALTLGWTGTLAKARTLATTVYTDQANTFGAFAQQFQAGARFVLVDPTDNTKVAQLDLSNIAAGQTRQINVPNANSTTVQASSAVANQFLTGVSAQGVVSRAQPSFSDVSGTLGIGAGGTGQTSASAAFDVLSPNTTRGDITVRGASSNARLGLGGAGRYLRSDGTDLVYSLVAAGGAGGCTNQFIRTANDNAIPTCASVATADVANDAIDNTKAANMADSTIKGRAVGAGSGDPTDLTGTQATAILDVATTALKGLMSSADKVKLNGIYKDAAADCGLNVVGGANTDASVQACYDSFTSTGGVLHVGGTINVQLNVASTITISKPVITIGDGRSISVFVVEHATKTLFTFASGSQGGGFEQIRISAPLSTTRTAGFAVDFGSIANVYMQQCDILFQWSGVHSGGALQFLDDMNIREMGANAANAAAVLVDGTGDRYLRRLTTDNPSDPTGFAAVRVRECSSLVLTDSNLINGGNALDIVPNAGSGHAVASVLATGTFFDSSVIGVNILPATSSDTAHRVRFVNCWFGSNTTANFRIGNGTIPNANIASIDILGSDFFGVTPTDGTADDTPFGLDVLGATEWSVRASRFGGHVTNAIRVAVGAGSADHNFSITDNLIANCLGAGVNAQGITIGAGTYGRYQIEGNRGLDTNTTVGISDSGVVGVTGSKLIGDNPGVPMSVGPLQFVTSAGAAVTTCRGTVTSTTVETFLCAIRVQANSVSVGQTIHVTMTLQSSAAGTFTGRIKAGTTGTIASDTLLSATAASVASANTRYTILEAWAYVVALGPTATVTGTIRGSQLAAVFQSADAAEVLANVPTTGVWFIVISGQASIAGFTVKSASVEIQ